MVEKENKNKLFKGWGYILVGYIIVIGWWLTIALYGRCG